MDTPFSRSTWSRSGQEETQRCGHTTGTSRLSPGCAPSLWSSDACLGIFCTLVCSRLEVCDHTFPFAEGVVTRHPYNCFAILSGPLPVRPARALVREGVRNLLSPFEGPPAAQRHGPPG